MSWICIINKLNNRNLYFVITKRYLKSAKDAKKKLAIGVTQPLLSSSSSDSERDMLGQLDDSSDDLLQHYDEDLTRPTFLKDDYVVVRFECRTMVKHYVGIVHDTDKHKLEVKFHRKNNTDGFVFPDEDDVSTVPPEDIIERLPNPHSTGCTARTKKTIQFGLDLQHIICSKYYLLFEGVYDDDNWFNDHNLTPRNQIYCLTLYI